MNCTDSSVEPLIADYYTGELTIPERGKVEAHVVKCESCRRTLHLLESLSGRRSKSRYAKGHVAPEVLMEYFRQGSSWPTDRAAEVKSHLDTCDICRADWQFMSELSADLESAYQRRAEPARRPLFLLRWNWITSPALAWLLVAAAAYPTLSWLKSQKSAERADPATLAAGPIQPLVEARRGQSRDVEVIRTDASALVRLTLPQGALPNEMSYRFTVLEEARSQVLPVEIISNFSEPGRILVLMNTRGLADGTYSLQISETNRASGSLESERGYRFRLVTRP
jgi:anti-sigma factor RsiW